MASASDDFVIRFYLGSTLLETVSRVSGNVTTKVGKSLYELTMRSTGTSGALIDIADFTDGITSYISGTASTHAIDTTATTHLE